MMPTNLRDFIVLDDIDISLEENQTEEKRQKKGNNHGFPIGFLIVGQLLALATYFVTGNWLETALVSLLFIVVFLCPTREASK